MSIVSQNENNYKDICDKIIEEINERYMENITLSDFALLYNYSVPHLSKKFKKETGCNFSNYLQKVRIDQSCRILLTTDLKVNEVALLSGYSDVKFFSEIFKKFKNVSPGKFRIMNK